CAGGSTGSRAAPVSAAVAADRPRGTEGGGGVGGGGGGWWGRGGGGGAPLARGHTRPFGQPRALLPEARHPRWSAGAGTERTAGYAAWSWEC
ncbi:hypothetical protein, partial [Nocardia abscessus]|uniref:hypothetical protein n=1 Tax=Nocardia abscessus TaxID=120957 RepID=UPI003CC7D006